MLPALQCLQTWDPRRPRLWPGNNNNKIIIKEEEEEEWGTYRALSKTQSALQLKEKHTMRKCP